MFKNRKTIIFVAFILSCLSCTKVILDDNDVEPIDRIIKYEPGVQTILANNCISCHGGSNPVAGVDLSTYKDARFYTENGKLIGRINDISNPMPPSGLMPSEQIQTIEKWVEDGFLEN